MKLEPRFTSRNNALFFLDGTPLAAEQCPEIPAAECTAGALPQGSVPLCAVLVPWSLVGLDEDSYNEEFLAAFRDWLKALEQGGQYAFLVPVADRPAVSAQEKEALVASVRHCARRVKDCASVAGVAVPAGFSAQECAFFIEEISRKHAQFRYFSRDAALLAQDESIVRY